MGYIKPEIKEQADRERRANIHRWFSQHINIELEPWQLEYICNQLELRSKSADPEETEKFECTGTREEWDRDRQEREAARYEEWKRFHHRWVREQNAETIRRELNNSIPEKPAERKTGTFGWWRGGHVTWGHQCTFGGEYHGEIIIPAVYPRCGNCGVERPQTPTRSRL